MPKLRAIVLDTATDTLRYARVKIGKETKAGKIIFVDKAGAALLRKQVWKKTRKWRADRRYVLIKEGDPRPLVVDDKGVKPAEYDASMFKAAITTTIATKFLTGGTDWKTLTILLLGFIVLVMAIVIYQVSA